MYPMYYWRVFRNFRKINFICFILETNNIVSIMYL